MYGTKTETFSSEGYNTILIWMFPLQFTCCYEVLSTFTVTGTYSMSQRPGEVCHKLKRLKTEMLGLFTSMQQPATTWSVYLQFKVQKHVEVPTLKYYTKL